MRIEGYKAIVRISEEQPRWVERNVDVLMQLLQSDEPAEVAVVKAAPYPAPRIGLQDYAERSLRSNRPPRRTHGRRGQGHLRTLVGAFLEEDARRPLLTKLQGRGNTCAEQEQALIDTLLHPSGFRSNSRVRGGREKCSCESVSRLGVQRKEEQTSGTFLLPSTRFW
ncbi:hypothetical protein BGW80DRAFT_458533 [Lactifluus volemus]|nr:hypothetical protein BGW80DRAFT_458533 [Lactifluus volemus]